MTQLLAYLVENGTSWGFEDANEAEAFKWFCSVRWPQTKGWPVCPGCGGGGIYVHKTRRVFRCSNPACRKDFSPTAGTQWNSRKLSYVKIRAIMTDLLENNPSAHQLAARHDINPRAASLIKRRMR